jgi:hypothetical protein
MHPQRRSDPCVFAAVRLDARTKPINGICEHLDRSRRRLVPDRCGVPIEKLPVGRFVHHDDRLDLEGIADDQGAARPIQRSYSMLRNRLASLVDE